MTAKELFQAGKLNEAIQALTVELRANPADVKRRTFLFELLCFSGEYDRAEKQLEILGKENDKAELGALLYRAALSAERSRLDLFQKKDYPKRAGEEAAEAGGVLNGKPFTSIADSDPRIGARLEVFVAGSYMWIPFQHIASLEMQSPKRVRDLLWIPTIVRASDSFKGRDLGEVLVPATTAFACRNEDELVKLGRQTVDVEENGEVYPVGAKELLVDDELFPLLEVRTLEFKAAQTAAVQ